MSTSWWKRALEPSRLLHIWIVLLKSIQKPLFRTSGHPRNWLRWQTGLKESAPEGRDKCGCPNFGRISTRNLQSIQNFEISKNLRIFDFSMIFHDFWAKNRAKMWNFENWSNFDSKFHAKSKFWNFGKFSDFRFFHDFSWFLGEKTLSTLKTMKSLVECQL